MSLWGSFKFTLSSHCHYTSIEAIATEMSIIPQLPLKLVESIEPGAKLALVNYSLSLAETNKNTILKTYLKMLVPNSEQDMQPLQNCLDYTDRHTTL